MKADFSGYATKVGLECSDGVTILAHAFKDQDGARVPLMWQHMHDAPENVLGHVDLENREDGVYAHAYFNDTETAKVAKQLVLHGDINSLSIWANKVVRHGKNVVHGAIKEVSLVLAGANPGALIQSVNIAHADGIDTEAKGEALIFTGLVLQHDDEGDDVSDKTVQEVYDSMNEEQQLLMQAAVADALNSKDDKVTHGDDDESDDSEDATDEEESDESNDSDEDASNDESEDSEEENNSEEGNSDENETINHSQEGINMSRNVFETHGQGSEAQKAVLTHSQIKTIVDDAKRTGSFKESVLSHAVEFGIENIEILFPDAKALATSPDFIKRRTEWVASVIDGAKKSPFARVKTLVADITADEARALGYVKGNKKKDEIVKLLKRRTDPTTIYKKQKLDRDDMIDITDFDVVAWLKAEMRLMLDEELARAILIGDGRSSASDDKIRDPEGAVDGTGIRSIAHDDDMYAHQVVIDSSASVEAKIEALIRARANYRGDGLPTFYTTQNFITDILLSKDRVGRRIYTSLAEVASAILADKIVPVEVMETDPEIVGIFVNMSNYTIGANQGGQLSMFDDFDIDYNQYKYLMETRVSGALTKPKSAVVIRIEAGDEATPVSPNFDGSTNTITIPNTTGIEYRIDSEARTGSVVITEDTQVDAVAAEGYYIPAGTTTNWTFVFTDQG